MLTRILGLGVLLPNLAGVFTPQIPHLAGTTRCVGNVSEQALPIPFIQPSWRQGTRGSVCRMDMVSRHILRRMPDCRLISAVLFFKKSSQTSREPAVTHLRITRQHGSDAKQTGPSQATKRSDHLEDMVTHICQPMPMVVVDQGEDPRPLLTNQTNPGLVMPFYIANLFLAVSCSSAPI